MENIEFWDWFLCEKNELMKTRHQMIWLNRLIVLTRGSQYPSIIDIEHFELCTPPTYVCMYMYVQVWKLKICILQLIIQLSELFLINYRNNKNSQKYMTNCEHSAFKVFQHLHGLIWWWQQKMTARLESWKRSRRIYESIVSNLRNFHHIRNSLP